MDFELDVATVRRIAGRYDELDHWRWLKWLIERVVFADPLPPLAIGGAFVFLGYILLGRLGFKAF